MKKLLLTIVLLVNVYSSQFDDIKLNFKVATSNIINIIQNKNNTQKVRNEMIIKAISPMFDFRLMAKLSLGKRWKIMKKSQRKEFVKLYVKRMKKSYSSKIDKYTNEKIIVNNIKQVKKTRVILNTSLVSADDKLEVIYKFYKPKKQRKNKNMWLIYDVIIEGVSIIKTDKAQFRAVLQDSSIQELMSKLK